MLELYYFSTATYGLEARLAAEEKGVDYVSRVLDCDAGELNTPAYRAGAHVWMKRADEDYLPALGALTYAVFVRHKVLEQSPEDLQAYYDAIPDPERRVAPGIRIVHTQIGRFGKRVDPEKGKVASIGV